MNSILVTGAAGFIGSHLVERCVAEGYKLKAFVHYNSLNLWGWLEHSSAKNHIEVVSGDIRDFDSVNAAIKGTDTIFHLAALIGIPYSYVSPKAYIDTNIVGTYNVLQAALMQNTEQVLVTSTSETYGSAQYVPIDEKHPLVGQSPYSASKIAADQLALSYYRSFGLPVKIVRPFNTYGPRQSARAFIPNLIAQVLASRGEPIQLGNLEPTRDLTFVEDTVSGFLEIARSGNLFGKVTNIATNHEISMLDLNRKIQSLLGTEIPLKQTAERSRPDASEVSRLKGCNSLILKNTSWRPQFDLEAGLRKTIAWIKDNRSIYKERMYVI